MAVERWNRISYGKIKIYIPYNLYALSQWFGVPIDAIICGNRKSILSQKLVILENPRDRRLYSYYKNINELVAA